MTLIGTTVIGLEDAAIKETNGKLKSDGRISFEKIPKNPLTLNTIYELVTSFKFKYIDEIKKQVKKNKNQAKRDLQMPMQKSRRTILQLNDY